MTSFKKLSWIVRITGVSSRKPLFIILLINLQWFVPRITFYVILSCETPMHEALRT
jgi:hypothetical protein